MRFDSFLERGAGSRGSAGSGSASSVGAVDSFVSQVGDIHRQEVFPLLRFEPVSDLVLSRRR